MFDRLRRWVAQRLFSETDAGWWWEERGRSTPSGVKVSPSVAMQQATVSRCVALIADTAAMMPLRLYKTRIKGGRDERPKHPGARLALYEPNGFQTPFEFWRHIYHHAAIRGNGYAYTPRDGSGHVTAMIPLHSDYVRVFVDSRGLPVYEFTFTYGGEQMRVGPEGMFHLKWRSDDGYVGISPIYLAARTIGMAIAVDEHGARFFGDGARAGGVLSIPGKLSKDAVARVRGQWETQHQGLEGSRKITVLSDGAEYKDIAVTPEESQFLETRMFQSEDICRIWGVPPFLVGATQKSTSWGTGLEQTVKGFLAFTLQAWLIAGAQAAKRSLLMPTELERWGFEHDTDILMATDAKARADTFGVYLLNGVMSPNEVRAEEGRNPYQGGDKFRVPSNTVPQDAENGAKPGEKPPETPQDGEDPAETDENDEIGAKVPKMNGVVGHA